MALTAIQKLDLLDSLDDLMVKASSAKGLDLLDVNDQIDELMIKLGYGQSASTTPPDSGVPAIVTNFMAGQFDNDKQADYVSVLHALEPYVGQFITFEEVQGKAAAWVDKLFGTAND